MNRFLNVLLYYLFNYNRVNSKFHSMLCRDSICCLTEKGIVMRDLIKFMFFLFIVLSACSRKGEEPLSVEAENCKINCAVGFVESVDYGSKVIPAFPDGEVLWGAYQYENDGTVTAKGDGQITTPNFDVVFELGKEAIVVVSGTYNSHDALSTLSNFMGQPLSGVCLYTGGFVSETPMRDQSLTVPCSIYNGIVGVKYILPGKVVAEDGTEYTDINLKSYWKVLPEVKSFNSTEAVENKTVGGYIPLSNQSEQLTNIVDPAGTFGCVYSMATNGTVGFKVYNGTTYLQDLQTVLNVEEGVCKIVTLTVNAKRQTTGATVVFDAQVTILEQNLSEDI